MHENYDINSCSFFENEHNAPLFVSHFTAFEARLSSDSLYLLYS